MILIDNVINGCCVIFMLQGTTVAMFQYCNEKALHIRQHLVHTFFLTFAARNFELIPN